MYSVLLYPNITSPHSGLEADSYVIAIGQLIRALNVVRSDLEFTALTPTIVESWRDIENVRQVEYDVFPGKNAMRCDFRVDEFKRAIDWKHESYDLVWCHLPEHAQRIRNVFANLTNEQPRMVGYCHWFEVPEVMTAHATMLWDNLVGILAMDECGLNSAWLRDIVLGYARKALSPAMMAALERRLVPMHLGIEPTTAVPQPAEPGLLVWNHRTVGYTGWPKMVAALDDIWTRRQDFRVMVTMGAEGLDKPWIVPAGITAQRTDAGYRTEYLTALSRAWYGLPRINCQWALSVTDGLMMGVPYILPNDFCYPEMVPPQYALYEGDVTVAIERALDRHPTMRRMDVQLACAAGNRLEWPNRVLHWSAQFDRSLARLPVMGDRSKRYADLLPRAAAGASKDELMKHMGWGVGIPWSPYRNRLRADGIPVRHDYYGVEG